MFQHVPVSKIGREKRKYDSRKYQIEQYLEQSDDSKIFLSLFLISHLTTPNVKIFPLSSTQDSI